MQLVQPRRRTAHRLFDGLQEIGYCSAYDSVQRLIKHDWLAQHYRELTHSSVAPR